MHEIIPTALRALTSVSLLLILTRIMGKKQVAQLTFFDYVIGISIGSIAAQCVVDPSVYLWEGIVGLFVFMIFSVILSKFSMKSYWVRKLLDGVPVVLIENGTIIESGLKKTKLTVNDLLEECRQKDVFDLADIAYAILETSGQLSLMLKPEKQPLTPQDSDIKPAESGICVNIIIDGKIIKKHLQMMNKDEAWLDAKLQQQNSDISEILLACLDDQGGFSIYIKDQKPKIHLLM